MLLILQPISVFASAHLVINYAILDSDLMGALYIGSFCIAPLFIIWILQLLIFGREKLPTKERLTEEFSELPTEPEHSEPPKKARPGVAGSVLFLMICGYNAIFGGLFPILTIMQKNKEEREFQEWRAENVELVYWAECSQDEIFEDASLEFKIYVQNVGKEAYTPSAYFRGNFGPYGMHLISPIGEENPTLEANGEPYVITYSIVAYEVGTYKLKLYFDGEEHIIGEYVVKPNTTDE